MGGGGIGDIYKGALHSMKWGDEGKCLSVHSHLVKWGICSKGNEEREFIPWSGEEEGKLSMKYWESGRIFVALTEMKESGGTPCVGRLEEALVRLL